MVGSTSEAITEQVRQANDIADVVSSYVTLKRAGRRFKALCPFHREKTPSFHVNVEMQVFKCFGCGVGGDVFKFVQLRENVGFLEARTILAVRAGISLNDDRRSDGRETGPSKTDLERANRWACQWFRQQLRGPAGGSARAYVQARGIGDASVERFTIGYAPDSWDALCRAGATKGIPSQLLLAAGLTKERGERGGSYDAFRHRLIFPIRDVMDRVVGFGGRTLGEDSIKYLNSPQNVLFDKSRCLFGLDAAKRSFGQDRRTAVVVEGYTDCIMAHQYGFSGTVATLGTALTLEHVRLLRRYVDTVILVFDSDAAGRRAADRSLQLFLDEQLDVRLAHVPEAKDPAEMLQEGGSEGFQAVLTSAADALEFKWKQLSRQYRDVSSGPGRRRAIEEFLGLIAGWADRDACDPIQRGLVLNQVGKLLGLGGDEVHRQLRMLARRRPRPRSVGGTPPADAQGSEPSAAPDAADVAMRQLLEVLLNEPSYFPSIASEFDPDLISDRQTREIARAVVRLAEENRDFALRDLISRFESVETSSRITAMHTAGQRRGNPAATVEGAVRRLQQLREHRRISDLEAGLRRKGDPKGDASQVGPQGDEPAEAPMDDRSMVRAMSQGARQMHGFAARRHLPR